MNKVCALCKSPARLYCEADEASLCWDCDSKVHRANFIVAKHERTLLCRACRSPTPWTASGTDLNSTTVSLCVNCGGSAGRVGAGVKGGVRREDSRRDGGEVREEIDAEGELVRGGEEDGSEVDDDDDDDVDNDEDDDDDDDASSEDDDEDNQVVPWSNSSPPPPPHLPPPPPPATSSSSSDGDDDHDYYSTKIQRRRKTASSAAGNEPPMAAPLNRNRQIPSDPQSQEDPEAKERSTPQPGGGVGVPVAGASREDHSGGGGSGSLVLSRNGGGIGIEPLAVDGFVVVGDRTTGSSSIVESSSSSISGRVKRGVDFRLDASTTTVAAELSKRPRNS